jgi:hypothetical protein
MGLENLIELLPEESKKDLLEILQNKDGFKKVNKT